MNLKDKRFLVAGIGKSGIAAAVFESAGPQRTYGLVFHYGPAFRGWLFDHRRFLRDTAGCGFLSVWNIAFDLWHLFSVQDRRQKGGAVGSFFVQAHAPFIHAFISIRILHGACRKSLYPAFWR